MKLKYYLIGCLFSVITGFICWKLFGYQGLDGRILSLNNVGSLLSEPDSVIVVGEEKITRETIDFEYKILTKDLFEDTDFVSEEARKKLTKRLWGQVRDQILTSMVERKLLFQLLSGDSGFSVSSGDLEGECLQQWEATIKEEPELYKEQAQKQLLKVRLCEQYIVDKFMSERVYADSVVTDEQAEAYFNQNRSDYHLPKRVKIRHIQLVDEKTAKTVRNKATAANFHDLAKEYSISPEAKDGGVLGPFAKNEMPAFFAEAFKLRANSISQIIKSTYGFHIIMPIAKYEEKTLAFDEVKADIKEKLIRAENKGKYQKWLDLALNSIEVRALQEGGQAGTVY